MPVLNRKSPIPGPLISPMINIVQASAEPMFATGTMAFLNASSAYERPC